MSDLISKTAAIRQLLSSPEGLAASNSDIAKVVGCEASTVRKVRMEMETETLREENARLREENKALADELAKMSKLPGQLAGQATQPMAAARRSRRVANDDRPLFERPGDDGQPVAIVGTL